MVKFWHLWKMVNILSLWWSNALYFHNKIYKKLNKHLQDISCVFKCIPFYPEFPKKYLIIRPLFLILVFCDAIEGTWSLEDSRQVLYLQAIGNRPSFIGSRHFMRIRKSYLSYKKQTIYKDQEKFRRIKSVLGINWKLRTWISHVCSSVPFGDLIMCSEHFYSPNLHCCLFSINLLSSPA